MTPLTVQGRHPPGGETKPFLWGNRSFVLISKMHFFFPPLRKKEIEIIHSSCWTLDESLSAGGDGGHSAAGGLCTAPAPTRPVVRRIVGLVESHSEALIPSQSSSQGSTFRVDFMLNVFHDIPVL